MFNVDKSMFFDRAKVVNKVGAGCAKALSKIGSFLRQSARSGLRRRKKSAKPGNPPTNVTGLLKDFIYFGLEPELNSVVVGPQKLNNRLPAGVESIPRLLEMGGTSTTYRGKSAIYHAFPFMKPALDANLSKFPEAFSGVVV